MKSVLRATAILTSSSFAAILAGLVTAKVNAVVLGPTGVGLFGLLQGVLGLFGLVAGFGIGTGLVRSGAKAIEQDDEAEKSALWTGAWILYWLFTLPVGALVVLFRTPIAVALAGGAANAGAVAWMGVALPFAIAAGLHVSFINAHHRVGMLARVGILNAVAQTTFAVTLILTLGYRGIPLALLASNVSTWIVSRLVCMRSLGGFSRTGPLKALAAAKRLARFGGPYVLSLLAGSGARLVLPVLVVHLFGQEEVGYVRAATALAVTYIGFIVNAMSQDYYPRLSAAADYPARICRMVNEQLNVIYLIAVPLVFLAIGLAPVILPLIYSGAFKPAVRILEWQLSADLFKFTSWAFGFVILARGRTVTFFVTEAVAGALLLGTCYLGLRLFALEGVGIAYVAAYASYFIIVYLMVRRDVGFSFSRQNLRCLAIALSLLVLTRVVLYASREWWAYAVPASIGLIAALLSCRRILQLWHAPDQPAEPA